MSWYRRLVNLVRSDRLSREIDRELSFHLAERADELMERGMSEAEARREAQRRFGNLTVQKERTREVDLLAWVESLLADLRYALRALRGSPGFAVVAILSLGLGIGANTAVFSLIDAVMLEHLPVRAPEELVRVIGDDERAIHTNPLWEQVRDHQDVFSSAFAFGSTQFNLSQGGEERPVAASWVSGDFFNTLGVRPVLGRLIARADDRRGCAGLAVLGHGFWQREYGGDAGVIGKSISLDGHPFQVIGVTDPAFFGMEVGQSVQVYAPLCAVAIVEGGESSLNGRSMWWLRIVGRPKPGFSRERVSAGLAQASPAWFAATLPPGWSADSKASYLRRTMGISSAATGESYLRREYSKALFVLMVVVAIVLLIACANVANLLLARAAAREREIAVRLAIGAGRARIMRQLLTESVLLSFLGALAGVGFALWGNRVLIGLLSTSRDPIWLDLSINGRVLGFAIATATLTGLLFGLAPAWRSTKVQAHAVIKAHARSVVRGDSRFNLGKALVSAQIALCLVLVMAAALLLGTFQRLQSADTGFTRQGVLLAAVDLRSARLPAERRNAAFAELLRQTRTLSGVRNASASNLTPISGSGWNDAIVVDGYTAKSQEDALSWINQVSDRYFATMGMTMLQGRDFDGRDVPGSQPVAIVTQSLARKFFGTDHVIGKQFRTRRGDALNPPIEIVGIVRDTKYESIRIDLEPTAFLALSQDTSAASSLNFEMLGENPAALSTAFTALTASIDPRGSVRFTTLERQVAESLTQERLLATLSGFFGGLALLLATIGLYGVISYSVARRRNEIGVRIALGSARSGILQLVLSDVSRIVAFGLVIGSGLALASSRLIAAFLYGVTPSDRTSLFLSAGILAAVSLLAGALPAARAARLDPMTALRED